MASQYMASDTDLRQFRLYEIANDYVEAIELFFESEDEKKDFIYDIKDAFEIKCVSVAKYIKNIEANAEAAKNAANDMAARANGLFKKAERLTEYLKNQIHETGLCEPIKCAEFDIKIAKNPPSLVITDPEWIPEIYKKTEVVIKIDKTQIKKDIQDGFEVSGAVIETKTRLVIK